LGLGSVDVTVKQFFGSVNAGYRFLDVQLEPQLPQGPRLSLDAYAGARYTHFKGELDFRTISDDDNSLDWWDPLIGLRANLAVTSRLAIVARGDIGGFGGCERTWFLLGGVEWRPFESTSI